VCSSYLIEGTRHEVGFATTQHFVCHVTHATDEMLVCYCGLLIPSVKAERDLSFAMFHVRNHCSDYVRYHQQLVGNVNFGSYRYKFNFIRFSQKGFISQTLVRYIKYRRIYFKHSSILLPQKKGRTIN
jgi:hypothetical protein